MNEIVFLAFLRFSVIFGNLFTQNLNLLTRSTVSGAFLRYIIL